MGTFDTRAESSYSRLRSDILTGRLLPGQRLLSNDLTARYGASVGALREGLSRLVEQGLVTTEPHHGFRVKPIDTDDLKDLTDARREIETMCLRWALKAGDLAWESRLVAAHHVLDGTPQLSDEDPRKVNEEWALAHANFHAVLLEACPNRRLRDIASALRDEAELYRRWSRHLRREDGRDIPAEHKALLAAALGRDVDVATDLLARHIDRTTLALLIEGVLPNGSLPAAQAGNSP